MADPHNPNDPYNPAPQTAPITPMPADKNAPAGPRTPATGLPGDNERKADKPTPPLNTLRKTKAEKPITVTFVGDPRGAQAGFKANDPAPAVYGDKEFPKGKAVIVDDSTWIAQYGQTLRKNSHFTVE